MRILGDSWNSGQNGLLRETGDIIGLRNFAAVTEDSGIIAASLTPVNLLSMARGGVNPLELTPWAERAGETDIVYRIGADGPQEQNPGGDTIGATTGTAGAITVNGAAQNGFVNIVGDDDWYAVTLVAGQSYTFTLNGVTLPDAYLELYDSTGALIGIDDDFGTGANAQLRWTATTSGTYYINARAFEDPSVNHTGSYTLTAVSSAPASPLDAIDYHFTMPGPNIAIWFAPQGYVNPLGDTAVRAWTQDEINAFFAAAATFSAITPLTFSLAASEASANWIVSLVELEGNTLGYFAPNTTGYGAFDPTVANWAAGLVPGGNSWITLIHEMGHGLGLAHPHDNGAFNYGTNNSEIMQGVLDPFGSFGTFGMNRGLFTTMTYNDEAQSTPMGLDVALLQQRYGVNPNTGSGNTSYTLSLTAASYICIWDVSGTDSISYSGSGNATIDLRAATLQNAAGGGGYVSSVQGVVGGFTIANGVVIENATGGSGSDTLIGNDANNTLSGGAGSGANFDTMMGGLGNDTYIVRAASDFVVEALNAGTDTALASVTYTLTDNVENLTLTGASAINGTGNGLNNTMTGNDAANSLNGGGGADIIDGGLGADTMTGGVGDDIYSVDNAGDAVTELSGEGRDTVFTSINYTLGTNVEDLAATGSSGLLLYGNALNNLIVGNGAVNTLDGGAGVDTLVGGLGDDLYVVENISDLAIELAGGGRDTIYTALAFYQLGENVEDLAITGTAGTYCVGNSVDNLMVGNSGADALDGGLGADFMVGAAGDDFYFADNISDLAIELAGGGRDTIYTSLVFYQIGENVEDVVITGTTGTYAVGNAVANLMVGNSGADAMDGGLGADFMVGGAGNDSYFVDNISDVIVELSGEGRDTVYTALAFYQIGDHVEEVSINGGAGSTIIGNALNNLMVGNSAADSFNGGAGADTLTGNAGNDVFVFVAGQANGDVITDFTGNGAGAGDVIQFQGYGTAAAGATFVQLDATHWQINSADGTIHDVITLANGASIDPSDYIFGP